MVCAHDELRELLRRQELSCGYVMLTNCKVGWDHPQGELRKTTVPVAPRKLQSLRLPGDHGDRDATVWSFFRRVYATPTNPNVAVGWFVPTVNLAGTNHPAATLRADHLGEKLNGSCALGGANLTLYR